MGVLKASLSTLFVGATMLAISTAAIEVTATASPTPTATPTPRPTPTPVVVPAAGPLTIALTCDSGKTGSAGFTVTANGKSSAVSVKCGGSATVSNAAWKSGSKAVVHQTSAAPSGIRAADISVTLKATSQTVAVRNFRVATIAATTSVPTLAQTGGGLPLAPLGLALAGLFVIGLGGRLALSRRA